MDPTSVTLLLVFLIAIALLFDLLNGMHDAANSIATIVSTRVLSPFYAVLWAAFFNFAAYFIGTHFGFEAKVASTIGKGLISPEMVNNAVIFGALMGAITWNVLTWRLGIPSSSSHALVGGIIGAGVAKAGFGAIVWGGLSKTLIAIVLSPVTGFILGILLVVLVSWLFLRANPAKTDSLFRKLQLVSSALYSIGHGSNDAQKTAGIIAVLLFANGYYDEFTVPTWVVLSCFTVMGVGTMLGGWRIVHTMGSKITRLTPMQGACAETAGAITLFGATYLGIPVSTTHTITSSIVGVGSARRVHAVRWGIAGRIVWAWIITIPASALMGAVFYLIGARFM
ncbi:inorganic phosphate transporter [Tabrizicola oligotrophica]|uniref:Inorganic phosphate transporter n=1 Tax=Tabrizicola oligotrophica TaxID=2710650 RepID=A0A6M0QQN6_9RHOB|nr:inorganic phosphate transporter [Tabrizicola oligotrophica]NEY89646.1 inorganic phosphate transporter [Tabrizicola oligotrophica]